MSRYYVYLTVKGIQLTNQTIRVHGHFLAPPPSLSCNLPLTVLVDRVQFLGLPCGGSCFTMFSHHKCWRSLWFINYNFTRVANQVNTLRSSLVFSDGKKTVDCSWMKTHLTLTQPGIEP